MRIRQWMLILVSGVVFTACGQVSNEAASTAKTIVIDEVAPPGDEEQEKINAREFARQELLRQAIAANKEVAAAYFEISKKGIVPNVKISSNGNERYCVMEEKFQKKGHTLYTYYFTVERQVEIHRNPHGVDGSYTVYPIMHDTIYERYELNILFDVDPINEDNFVDLKGSKVMEVKSMESKSHCYGV